MCMDGWDLLFNVVISLLGGLGIGIVLKDGIDEYLGGNDDDDDLNGGHPA